MRKCCNLRSFVYLDNSATTKPSQKSIEYVNCALAENWGNPSSLHRLGMDAENSVNKARERLAGILKCRAGELVFTSSGTEANNTAILGAALKGAKRGKRIITTSIEHPSVLETFERLSSQGFEVVKLRPDADGVVPMSQVEEAVNENTVLLSMMLVNNETGAVQPVREAAKLLHSRAKFALMHCDAVQAFGKLQICPEKLGVDLMSVSGHKIHAPKGIGALYIAKNAHIPPLMTGGGQEGGMRSSTESVPMICGLGGALEDLGNIERAYEMIEQLNAYARQRLLETSAVVINSPIDALPYILNVSVMGYRSETLLHFLEERDIYVSSGSACAKGEGSYVLREMGLDRKRTDSALRISFSRENTKEDVDRLVSAITEATQKLRKASF